MRDELETHCTDTILLTRALSLNESYEAACICRLVAVHAKCHSWAEAWVGRRVIKAIIICALYFTQPDDQETMKDELAQMINYVLKDDNNQQESNEEEPCPSR